MLELALVLVLLAFLSLPLLLSTQAVFWLSAGLFVLGNLVGLPGGLVYHLRLRRALLKLNGELPPYWWWNPVPHHERIPKEERDDFLGAFYVGAAGFVMLIASAALFVVGFARVAAGAQ